MPTQAPMLRRTDPFAPDPDEIVSGLEQYGVPGVLLDSLEMVGEAAPHAA